MPVAGIVRALQKKAPVWRWRNKAWPRRPGDRWRVRRPTASFPFRGTHTRRRRWDDRSFDGIERQARHYCGGHVLEDAAAACNRGAVNRSRDPSPYGGMTSTTRIVVGSTSTTRFCATVYL